MPLAGGTFTGAVTLSGAPTANLHAATKAYVDANAGSNITGAATTIESDDLTVSRALISNASGKVAVSAVTSVELGYLDGVTSAIQTQLDAKQASNAKLTDIAGLAVTANNFIVGDGSNFVLKTPADARTAMGVDAAGTDNSTDVTLNESYRKLFNIKWTRNYSRNRSSSIGRNRCYKCISSKNRFRS